METSMFILSWRQMYVDKYHAVQIFSHRKESYSNTVFHRCSAIAAPCLRWSVNHRQGKSSSNLDIACIGFAVSLFLSCFVGCVSSGRSGMNVPREFDVLYLW